MPLILVTPYKKLIAHIVPLKTFSKWRNAGGGVGGVGGLNASTETYGSRGAYSEVGVTSGKHYFEITITRRSSSSMIGVGTISAATAARPYLMGGAATFSRNGDPVSHNVGDVIGLVLDADSRTLGIYANGVFAESKTIYIPASEKVHAVIADGSDDSGFSVTANFGASAFKYPVPEGCRAGLYLES